MFMLLSIVKQPKNVDMNLYQIYFLHDLQCLKKRANNPSRQRTNIILQRFVLFFVLKSILKSLKLSSDADNSTNTNISINTYLI